MTCSSTDHDRSEKGFDVYREVHGSLAEGGTAVMGRSEKEIGHSSAEEIVAHSPMQECRPI